MSRVSKKKHKKQQEEESRSRVRSENSAQFATGISRRGWKTIAGGVLLAALGFWVLSLTDPAGQNWASHISPFLIIGGYATIGIGILLPPQTEPHHSEVHPEKPS